MFYEWLALTFASFAFVAPLGLLIEWIVIKAKQHRMKEDEEIKQYIESYVQYRIRQDRMMNGR